MVDMHDDGGHNCASVATASATAQLKVPLKKKSLLLKLVWSSNAAPVAAPPAETNPPAFGGNISTCVLVHVLRLACRVRTVRAREAAVPEDPLLAHVSLCVHSRSLNAHEGP